MRARHVFRLSPCLVFFFLAFAGCEEADAPEMSGSATERPPMETRADSVAMVMYDSLGGPQGWASMPYLRFDFAFDREGERTVRNEHLWNRQTGDYRLEWTQGADSNYVALFNVGTRDGQVYLNSQPVDSTQNDEMVQRAYRSFINDTYWLMAPSKVFDPGVNREYVADSSDAEHDVIRLTFNDVGLTPGDTYWMWVNKNTGMMDRWAFVLQGNPDAAPRTSAWRGYERFEVPSGFVRLASRKESGPGAALLTDNLDVPMEVPADMFTDPGPRLD